jgi:hypothetical protein
MHRSIYRGYDIVEYDTEWKVELDKNSVCTFIKEEGVSGEASCMCEIDRIKRQERADVDANIQRVDAQVKLDNNIKKARNNGS